MAGGSRGESAIRTGSWQRKFAETPKSRKSVHTEQEITSGPDTCPPVKRVKEVCGELRGLFQTKQSYRGRAEWVV